MSRHGGAVRILSYELLGFKNLFPMPWRNKRPVTVTNKLRPVMRFIIFHRFHHTAHASSPSTVILGYRRLSVKSFPFGYIIMPRKNIQLLTVETKISLAAVAHAVSTVNESRNLSTAITWRKLSLWKWATGSLLTAQPWNNLLETSFIYNSS